MPSIDVVRLGENPHQSVFGIRDDTSSRGVDLEGAQITATYADGTVETLTWAAYDPYTNGGASGTDIDMSFGYDWHQLSTTKLLTSLRINLKPASSVFDTTTTDDDDPLGGSTPTSSVGYPFRVASEYEDLPGKLAVTYTGIVNLAGSPAEGDLYTTMIVDFSGLSGGGLLGDLAWNSDIDTMKFEGDLTPTSVACFTRGTLITTDRGDVPVELLKAGDRVLTQHNGYQTLKLALSRTVGSDDLRNNEKLYPVRIKAGAMGSGLPKRDLSVSRQHRMAVQSRVSERMFGASMVLLAAIRLVELPGIYVEDTIDSVEYFHLIFENHEVIFAEGAPSESFLVNSETRLTLGTAGWEEFSALFPEACDPEFAAAPACTIPTHIKQRKLVFRHSKNAKPLLGALRQVPPHGWHRDECQWA